MRFITGLLFTFICLLPAGSMAQNKVTLSGKVIDQHGTPIAQATIAVENTTSGTYTDNRGKYSLQVAPGKHTFVVSFLGYTHLIVQSTNIIDGVEMESLRRDVESALPFFKEIRVGTPLLYSVEDAEKVASILGNRYNAPAQGKKVSKEHFVLVGHGTYTPSTAIYSQMDYMLKAGGLTNFHVGTIEGYPTFDTMLAQLKAGKAKRVTLVPFMFVAGDHAKNDIAGEWKERLEKEDFIVSTQLEGLGQVPEIQEIFIDHIRFGLKHRMLDIMTKKAAYAAGKDTE